MPSSQNLQESLRLQARQLRLCLDPKDWPFASTESLEPFDGIIGQDRAVRAIRFGLEMQGEGLNS